jgi:hypothetical protein
MANSTLDNLIFNQFVGLVLEQDCRCKISFCDFDYDIREEQNHVIMIVFFNGQDACKRRRTYETTIDITDICCDDVTNWKWVDYLKQIAARFAETICPRNLTVVPVPKAECRKRVTCWQPEACTRTVTIFKPAKPIIKKPCKPEIVHVKNPCKCECPEIPECETKERIIFCQTPVKRACRTCPEPIVYDDASSNGGDCGCGCGGRGDCVPQEAY